MLRTPASAMWPSEETRTPSSVVAYLRAGCVDSTKRQLQAHIPANFGSRPGP
jgi:hypothetical protein